MNSIENIQQAFVTHIQTLFSVIAIDENHMRLHLNIDEDRQEFGNLTANIAMILAKVLKKAPRVVAQEIVSSFSHPLIERMDIAGPGFINIYLTDKAFVRLAQELCEQGETFFKPDVVNPRYNISLEFVSANPTGPLHFGHGRGAIIGDVLANVLRFMGHTVTKEFYINDAGNQIQKLGESFKIRCQQAAGIQAELPEDGYHGEYLLELAQDCFAELGHTVFEKPDSFFAQYAKDALLQQIRDTLSDYGIHYDVWFSEKILHHNGSIEKALAVLQQKKLLYEADGALWFATTTFGDDKDRVVRKATGEYTYIAADIAYFANKIERGANNLMFVLGYDHHSYAARLNAVKQALGFTECPLEVILYQLVKITEDGQLMRMSKRAGVMITLQDIINTVGVDVARFFYLNRKADAQLEFDIELALKKTEENPVYYVQYAYVRTGSIIAKADQDERLRDITAADAQFIGKQEALLLKKIIFLEQLLHDISLNQQTHLLTYYVLELAQLFHRYYSHVRVIDLEDINKTRGRLLIVTLTRNTIAFVLELLGISRPEKM